jgi:2-polyprenyl-6-methoxyphenol hydroxylase-like FAD-dependent oxidoreductase
MQDNTVLISGAGIAGLALAHWLRRYGFRPTVVERAPGLRSGGQAVDIRGAAREVIDRMGLTGAVRDRHTGTRGIAMVDARGRTTARMDAHTFGDSGGIVAEVEILRSDLVRILHGTAGDGVEYLFDDVITGLTETGDGVEATFEKAPARTFGLVVGADGVRSGVRSLAFGDAAGHLRDLGLYKALFTARTTRDMDGWEQMYNLPSGNGVGGRVALLYPVGSEGEARVMLAFVSPPLDLGRHDTAAHKDLLDRVFADGGWELPGLLEQMRATDDLYFSRDEEVVAERWSSGRAVLLGDAAHGGTLGMGTSMALVGAYVLAGELAAARGDHRVALPAYEDAVRDYVRANSKRPPGGATGMAPGSRLMIRLRDLMLRVLPYLPGKHLMMGGMQEAANAITLRDYPGAAPARSAEPARPTRTDPDLRV